MSVIDRKKLMEHVGDSPELLIELIELFLELGPGMFKDIQESVEQESPDGLQRSAHSLKGSVGNFAAEDTFEASLLLETMGRNKNLAGAQDALIVLQNALSRLFDELTSIKTELVSSK
ncbi:MAG: Hpt domain-containing protein [Desulfomonilaceae bacterium]